MGSRADRPSPDLVIVVPGLLGTALSRRGRPLWDARVSVMGRHALTRLADVAHLVLPHGIGDHDADDEVVPEHAIDGLHLMPGFWAVDGYRRLVDGIGRALGGPEGVVAFPYDWRLSARASARSLKQFSERALHAWQRETGFADAKAVYVCHSMGGIVARYHLDVLGGAADARMLITIGSPYRGSPNALFALATGIAPRISRVTEVLTPLVRSLPSAYQLLPTYRCVEVGDATRAEHADPTRHRLDGLYSLTAAASALDRAMVEDGVALHHEMAQARQSAAAPRYAVHTFGGYHQPTVQSVWLPDGFTGPPNRLRSVSGRDHGGDGTVPRFACHPPEWPDDTQVRYFPQKHSSLQNDPVLLHQISALLTATDVRAHLSGSTALSVDVPEIADGRDFVTVAVHTDDDRLSLVASAQHCETGERPTAVSFRNLGDGDYTTAVLLPASGTWRITVADATGGARIAAVTSLTTTGLDA